MASFNKKLAVAVGLTLTLLIASSNGKETSSFGGSALCDSSTGVSCTSDASCVTICMENARLNYVDGYCSPEHDNVVVAGGRSCVCIERCGAGAGAQSPQPPPPASPAWRRMRMLD